MRAAAASQPLRVGGVPEVVRDGVTGALLPLGDLDGMAAAVARFLDPAVWPAASAAAAADARARFATADVVARYEALYADARAHVR